MAFNANDFAASMRATAKQIDADRKAGLLRDFHGRLVTHAEADVLRKRYAK